MKNYFLNTAILFCGFSGLYAQIVDTSFNSSKDSYTISTNTNNYGTANTMYIGIGSGRSVGYRRGYVYFPIASIPANAIITSATLKVYQTSGATSSSSTEVYAERITQNWGETTVASGNEPSVSTSDVCQSSTYASSIRSFDVKTHVQKIVNGSYTNEGWRIRYYNELQTTSNLYSFDTREGTNVPVLEISYYIPLNISAASQTHCSTAVSTDGSITPTFTNGCGGTYTYEWINSSGSVVGTSASLTGRASGWYGLHAYNTTYNDHLYMAFLVGVKCQNTAITFNPGPNFIDDALLQTKTNGEWGDVNYGNSANLTSEVWTFSGVWYYRKSLLKFKLWLDNSLTINTANLNLIGLNHNSQYNTNPAELRVVSSNWNENVVTYNSPPPLGTSAITVPATATTTENKTLDVKSFWNTWKTNNNANYGLMFQFTSYANTYRKQDYYSSDATTSSNRPYMSFNVGINSGAVAGTATPTNSSICSGSTTTINLTGYTAGSTFQWQNSTNGSTFTMISGATSASYTTLSSTIVNTYYRCVVTAGICTPVNSNSVLITIKPIPTVTVNNAIFCTGSNVTLTATPSISGGTYLWSTGATTSSINVAPLVDTNYTVVYTLNGCAGPLSTGTVSVCGFTDQYNDSTETGEITVDISTVTNKVGPYHYQISDSPIEDISSVYHYLNDSLYNGSLDSATFFLGNEAASNFTFENITMGNYYVSVFDSRGIRIFDKEKLLIPLLTFDFQTNMNIVGNDISSTGISASGALDLYLNDGTKGSLAFKITDKSKTQFMGLIPSNNTSANDISDYEYGFSVRGGVLYLIEDGIEETTSYSIFSDSEFKLQQVDSIMEYYVDGVLLKSSLLSASYSYKTGFAFDLANVHVLLLPKKLKKSKFWFTVDNVLHYSCDGQLGGFTFNSSNVFQTSIAFSWSVYKDGVLVGNSTSATYLPVTDFNPSTFGPGVYTINGETAYQNETYYYSKIVTLGYEASWTDLISYDLTPNNYSVKRNSSNPNTYSYARSENILAQGQPGWVQMKIKNSQAWFDLNFLRLSIANSTSVVPVLSEISQLIFIKVGTNKYAIWPGGGIAPINSNEIISIKFNITGTIDIFKVNPVTGQLVLLIGNLTRPQTSILLRAHSLRKNAGFENVITSFDCSPKQLLSQIDFTELKRNYDGGYTYALEGKVKFTFDEEYQIPTTKYLPIKIYDDNHNLLWQSELDGTITYGTGINISELDYLFDDNRYTLNVSSIVGITPNAFYTLEVATSTNEKRFLKFQFKY